MLSRVQNNTVISDITYFAGDVGRHAVLLRSLSVQHAPVHRGTMLNKWRLN